MKKKFNFAMRIPYWCRPGLTVTVKLWYEIRQHGSGHVLWACSKLKADI